MRKKPYRSHGPPLALLVLLGVGMLFFWRFGYDYAVSDQDEILPLLFHQLDPTFFQDDWFVQSQATSFSVRDYTVGLLAFASRLVPVWLAVAGIYVLCWFSIGFSCYAISREVTEDRWAPAAAVALVLVFTPQWTLGGNDLIGRMLTPSMLGWAVTLPGVYGALRRRWLLAGGLLGAATWFQPLVGGLTAAALIGSQFLTPPRLWTRRRLLQVCRLAGAFVITALPTIIPLGLQQLGAAAATPAGMPTFFEIMAEFRNPHHYLPSEFSTGSYVHFGILAAGGFVALIYLHRTQRARHTSRIARLFGAIGILLVLGLVGTEVLRALFLTKLQLFKLTVLAKLFLVILIAGGTADILQPVTRLIPLQSSRFRWAGLGLLILAGSGTVVGIAASESVSDRLMRPWAREASPAGQMHGWIRRHTPRDAVFAVPPTSSSFRSNTRRSAVVTFKAFPFQPPEIIEWWKRLSTVASVQTIPAGGAAALPILDRRFHRHTGAEWQSIARRYDANFLLVNSSRQHPALPFSVAAEREPWILYRLPTDR